MKKCLFIAIFLVGYDGYGQKIALLSHDLKTPILYTDSVTMEQISSGRFAFAVNNIDTLVGSLAYLRTLLRKEITRSKIESWEFRAGNTVIKTHRIPRAYGDAYSIVATSTFDEVTSVFNITTEKNDKQNAKRIDEILKY